MDGGSSGALELTQAPTETENMHDSTKVEGYMARDHCEGPPGCRGQGRVPRREPGANIISCDHLEFLFSLLVVSTAGVEAFVHNLVLSKRIRPDSETL